MRTNVAVKMPAPRTHEGGVAVRISPVEQLRRSVMANMLFEDEFYEDGESIAKRIEETVAEILKTKSGPHTIANIAYVARTQMKLRHVPLLLAATLIHAKTEATRAVIAGTIANVVQRPDEMGELVALYWKVNGKRAMLPHQMKLGLAAAFRKFDAYTLGKWNSDKAAVKLRDVLFLAHVKPAGDEQAALFKKIVDKTLESPDTWEVALSGGADKKETFTRLLTENKLGALALLRNLRNMQGAQVDEELIRNALATMKTERVLPFRFISAAHYAPSLEPELEQAMFKCLEGYPRLKGKTVLVVDHSGSMDYALSGKSELKRFDAACALAMLLREDCERVEVVSFTDDAVTVPPRRGFALRDAIKNAQVWGGTYISTAVQYANNLGYDRCIVITDEQSHESGLGAPQGKGYFINVASNKNGIGYGKWTHIDGWSEAVVDYIERFEHLDIAQETT
jgi:60 kDa SS-A/Ro ribonucleoprotein